MDEVIVDVIETSLSREADDLVRGAQPGGFAARAAVAARDAPLAAGSAALGADPAPGGQRGVDVLSVAVAEAHAAEGDGEASAAAVGRGAQDVGLDRLLAAPVARGAELGVVDAGAHAEAATRVVAVRHGAKFGGGAGALRGGAATRGGEVVVVVQAVALGVVDLDALAGRAATLGLGDDLLDALATLLRGAGRIDGGWGEREGRGFGGNAARSDGGRGTRNVGGWKSAREGDRSRRMGTANESTRVGEVAARASGRHWSRRGGWGHRRENERENDVVTGGIGNAPEARGRARRRRRASPRRRRCPSPPYGACSPRAPLALELEIVQHRPRGVDGARMVCGERRREGACCCSEIPAGAGDAPSREPRPGLLVWRFVLWCVGNETT